MKKFNSILLASVVTMGISMAAHSAPVSVFFGPAGNNEVADEKVVMMQASTELSNVELGLSTEFDKDTMYTYGAFVGVPLHIQNTNVILTPRLSVDEFRKQNETLYGAGAKLSYVVSPGFTIDGVYAYRDSFDNDVDLDGDTYAVGITKTF